MFEILLKAIDEADIATVKLLMLEPEFEQLLSRTFTEPEAELIIHDGETMNSSALFIVAIPGALMSVLSYAIGRIAFIRTLGADYYEMIPGIGQDIANRVEIVKLLLVNGAPQQVDNVYPVLLLLGGIDSKNMLSADSLLDLVKCFLETGLDPNTILSGRKTSGGIRLFELMIEYFTAKKSEASFSNTLKLLFDYGLDIKQLDSKGRTILESLINTNDYNSIRMLLDKGADINGYSGLCYYNKELQQEVSGYRKPKKIYQLLDLANDDLDPQSGYQLNEKSYGDKAACRALFRAELNLQKTGYTPNYICDQLDRIAYILELEGKKYQFEDIINELIPVHLKRDFVLRLGHKYPEMEAGFKLMVVKVAMTKQNVTPSIIELISNYISEESEASSKLIKEMDEKLSTGFTLVKAKNVQGMHSEQPERNFLPINKAKRTELKKSRESKPGSQGSYLGFKKGFLNR